MIRPKAFWQDFKSFAFKGNMIDLAIGVIIGGAFGKVISSLVENIFMPLIAAIIPDNKGYESLALTINGSEVKYGLFLASLVDFLLVALAIFIVVVKLMQTFIKRSAPAPAPSEPTTRECPYCLSNIPIKATRCAHCTSDLVTGTGAQPAT